MNLATEIFHSIEKHSSNTAIVQNELCWTYAKLGEQAAGIARKLRMSGLVEGDRVILWMANCADYVASYLGIIKAGGVVVAMHPRLLPEEICRSIHHVDAAGLITTSQLWKDLKADIAVEALNFLLVSGDFVHSGNGLKHQIAPPNLAQIISTSGTTGQPKGVMLTHQNLLANTRSILDYLKLNSSDSIIALLPFVFSYGNSVMLTHLMSGAKLVIEGTLTYAKLVIDWMSREAVTGFSGVASTYAILLRQAGFDEKAIPSMRYFTSAGGPMPVELLRRVQEAFPRRDFIVMYGQTEASARLAYLPPSQLDRKKGSAGMAIPGVKIKIVKESGEEARPGELGEVVVTGENIMRGYWNDPENTRKILKEGWLHTGDLGYLDDEGFLFITGRDSEMIKSGAFRISPAEIEEVLFTHPEVNEAAVVGLEDEILGSVITGVIVPRPGKRPAVQDLLAHCARHLAPFKRPKSLFVIQELPKSPNGKIQRHLIRKLCSSLSALKTEPSDSLPIPKTSQ